jgi:hypothetical protein
LRRVLELPDDDNSSMSDNKEGACECFLPTLAERMNKNLSQRVLELVDIKLDVLTFIAFQAIGLLIFAHYNV